MKTVPESTTPDGARIPEKSVPKELKDYTPTDLEYVALDTGLQLIIVDSMDPSMSQQIISCESGKHMWDTIELIME